MPDEVAAGWSATDWAEQPGTAMSSRAPGTQFLRNRIRNVTHGISIAHDSPNARVAGNVIDGFSRDGLRGIGEYGVFEGNTVMNAYDVDDHHDDFFQSWSVGEDGSPGTGVIRGVVLRGNLFIGFTDPDRPFAGAAQGIGCFDGFYEGWIVENNVILVNHWHGITFLGARDVRIVNNTVLDVQRGERPGPPWIDVSSHKDGTPSEDIVIRNNLVMNAGAYGIYAKESQGQVPTDLEIVHNTVVGAGSGCMRLNDMSDPLAAVGGVTNAVSFETDLVGPVTIVGAGAGSEATGFALLSDLLAIHRSAD